MKLIEFGSEKFQQIETLFDMNDERFNVFKQHLLQVFEKIDQPSFLVSFNKYVAYHNEGRHADGIIEWYNFKKAMEYKELNYDAYSFCFALLTLEKDEDQRDNSTDRQLKKLERMRINGLTRGVVEATVENFIKASPNTFATYLVMLEMMKPDLQEEVLKK